VTAREAVLSDPAVVKLLKEHFVPLAINNSTPPNITPAEREFLRGRGFESETNGMSVFTADGRVLEKGATFDARGVERMLKETLAKFRKLDAPRHPVDIPPVSEEDRRKHIAGPPEGGLVLYVTWGVIPDLGKPRPPDGTFAKDLNRYLDGALGSDRMWLRKDEVEALAAGKLPANVVKRLTPHVSYAVAGDADKLKLTLDGGRLWGTFRFKGGDIGSMLGFVEAKNGKVTRFDLIAKGMGDYLYDDAGSACLCRIPQGRLVPVAVLFTLADPAEDFARVPASGARDSNYLK
jgi:hypothetical protein